MVYPRAPLRRIRALRSLLVTTLVVGLAGCSSCKEAEERCLQERDGEACQECCDLGRPQCCTAVGALLSRSEDPEEVRRGVRLWQEACDEGDPIACANRRGFCRRPGVEPERYQGCERIWARKGCDLDDPIACQRLEALRRLARRPGKVSLQGSEDQAVGDEESDPGADGEGAPEPQDPEAAPPASP